MLPIKESELATFAPIAPVGEPPRAKYEHLIMTAKKVPPATTIVVHPCEETSLRGAVDAAEAGIIKPILVGPAAKIASVAREFQLDIARYEVIDAPHSDTVAARGVQLIHEGKGRAVDEGEPAHGRVDARGHFSQERAAHVAADQPRVHHGRADPHRHTVHHRRPRRRAAPCVSAQTLAGASLRTR